MSRLSIKFLWVTLWHMSIRAGVIGAVALQQVDNAPHAKASAEGNNEGLQSVDGRSEKLHILLLFSGLYPAMKKAAPCRAAASVPRDSSAQTSLCYFGTKCPKLRTLRCASSSHKIADFAGTLKAQGFIQKRLDRRGRHS